MNQTTIEKLTEYCTVKLKVSNRKVGHATGFFIAPGIIVTCAHTLKDIDGREILFMLRGTEKYFPAKIKYSFAPKMDLVILEANLKIKHLCAYVGDEVSPRDPCFSFGYTDPQEGNPEGDPATLECEGRAGKKSEIIKLKEAQIRPGMSGAPLLNQRTGKICGVINKSRNRQIDLGCEAVSLSVVFDEFPALKQVHDDFHRTSSDWTDLLKDNVEPFESDWARLDRKSKRWASYLSALWFLFSVLLKWLILGLKAPRAFPIDTISLLIRHTWAGDLGQEINKQRKELTRKLIKVNLEAGGQARIINQLESKASVLSELINILIPESQNLASSSRLLWAVELIYQQQDLLNELKEIEGNSYPQLEKWKKRFGFLKTSPDKRYREVDKIVGKLLLIHSDSSFSFQNYFQVVLDDLLEIIFMKPSMGILIGEKILNYLNNKTFLKLEDFLETSKDQEDYTALVQSVFEELEFNIQQYPQLKVLNKMKILLESVAGKPITGGPYRAWGKSKTNKYHFSRKCKLYPERARPHEMNKINCYDSHEEARKNHEPCKNCISAENIESMDFVGEEPS